MTEMEGDRSGEVRPQRFSLRAMMIATALFCICLTSSIVVPRLTLAIGFVATPAVVILRNRSSPLTIFTAFVVVLIVFPVCYSAWFWALFNMVPSEFGMPTYEEEIELAFLVGSLAFSVVPLLISIRVCGFLNRRLLI